MATYTAITDTETGFEKPVTISLMRRLRDNPIAVQEGDATAPTIYTGIAAKHVGGSIGATHMLSSQSGPTTIVAGNTYAGSILRFSGVGSASVTSPFTAEIYDAGPVPAGTWKALGSAAGAGRACTIFIRIA